MTSTLVLLLLFLLVLPSKGLNPLSSLSRRAALSTATTTLISTSLPQQELPTPPYDPTQQYPRSLFSYTLLPLTSTLQGNIPTIESIIIPDKLITHTQLIGIVNVNTPIRSTIYMNNDEITIINPLQSTPEYLAQIKILVDKYGEVKHIILTSSAVEHRSSFNTFTQHFPSAIKYIPPGLYAFPLNLPSEYLGLNGRNIKNLEKVKPPNLEVEILGPLKFKSVGTFVEATIHIPELKTMIVTDTLCSITEDIPEIVKVDERPLLYHARNTISDYVESNEDNLLKGWKRMSLFGLCFFPSGIIVTPFFKAFIETSKVDSRMKNLNDYGVPLDLYPWRWEGDVDESFSRYGDGRVFVPPILTKLILDREPDEVRRWLNVITKWDFNKIIHAHYNEHTDASPKDVKIAVEEFLAGKERFLPGDLALLQEASDVLTKVGVVSESKICDGEEGRGDLGRRFK